jgi:hypothetical protein
MLLRFRASDHRQAIVVSAGRRYDSVMPRPRLHTNDAEKMRAYRARLRATKAAGSVAEVDAELSPQLLSGPLLRHYGRGDYYSPKDAPLSLLSVGRHVTIQPPEPPVMIPVPAYLKRWSDRDAKIDTLWFRNDRLPWCEVLPSYVTIQALIEEAGKFAPPPSAPEGYSAPWEMLIGYARLAATKWPFEMNQLDSWWMGKNYRRDDFWLIGDPGDHVRVTHNALFALRQCELS